MPSPLIFSAGLFEFAKVVSKVVYKPIFKRIAKSAKQSETIRNTLIGGGRLINRGYAQLSALTIHNRKGKEHHKQNITLLSDDEYLDIGIDMLTELFIVIVPLIFVVISLQMKAKESELKKLEQKKTMDNIENRLNELQESIQLLQQNMNQITKNINEYENKFHELDEIQNIKKDLIELTNTINN